MKNIILLLIISLFFCAGVAHAQTYSAAADSGVESSSPISSMATSNFSTVVVGDLEYCVAHSGGHVNYRIVDSAGNSLTPVADIVQDGTTSSWVQAFYGVVKVAGSNIAVNVTMDTNIPASYSTVTCIKVTPPTGTGVFVLDGAPAGVGGTSNTVSTSNSFSTTATNEIIIASWCSFGGDTFSAGTIGGVSATLRTTNDTNGTGSDCAIETLNVSSIQSSITAIGNQTPSNPWTMFVASFRANVSSPIIQGPQGNGNTCVQPGGASCVMSLVTATSSNNECLVVVSSNANPIATAMVVDNAGGGTSTYSLVAGPFFAVSPDTIYWNSFYLASPCKSGATTVTVTPASSAEVVLGFYELSGLLPTPTDQSGGTSVDSAAATFNAAALTTTVPRELLVSIGVGYTYFPGCHSPMVTDEVITSGGQYTLCHELLYTKGTYTPTYDRVAFSSSPYWTGDISLEEMGNMAVVIY